VTACEWYVWDGSVGRYEPCPRADCHDHNHASGVRHRLVTASTEALRPLRRLDIGFFPGAVFLLEGSTLADVERIKAAIRDVSEGEAIQFKDADFIIGDGDEGICGYPNGTAYCAILTRPGLAGDQRIKVLAHEVFHAAYRVLKIAGMRLSDDSEEVYAYLVEHLLGQAIEPEDA